MPKLSRTLLWTPEDPYRGDKILRLGADGQPSGLHSRVKQILSSDKNGAIYEVCDDANRTLYIIRSGAATWLEVELD